MGFKLLPLVAVALLGLGNLLHIIGLATPEWVRREETRHSVKLEYTSGLWEFCTNDECDSIDNEPDTMTGISPLFSLSFSLSIVPALSSSFYTSASVCFCLSLSLSLSLSYSLPPSLSLSLSLSLSIYLSIYIYIYNRSNYPFLDFLGNRSVSY